jgi:hypothetical protein
MMLLVRSSGTTRGDLLASVSSCGQLVPRGSHSVAGFAVREVELPLAHRATGRTWRGFLHRGRQLADVAAAWAARR